MKSRRRTLILGMGVLISLNFTAQVSTGAEKSGKTLKLNNVEARQIFQQVAKDLDVNVLLHPSAKGTITGEFDGGSSDLFNKLAEAAGFKIYQANKFYLVYGKDWSPPDSLKKEIDSVFKPADGAAKPKALRLENVDLHSLLEAMAKGDGLKLTIPKDLDASVTARLVGVRSLDVIRLLLAVNDCSLIERDGAYEVVVPPNMKYARGIRDGVSKELQKKAEAGDVEALFAIANA